MQRSFRHKAIIHAVSNRGPVSIGDLTRLTGASAVTVRRDLRELERHGAIRRTRGGAMRPAPRGIAMPFALRYGTDVARKNALGEYAAGLVDDDESVIVDNGTTCYAVARALAGRPITTLALSLHAAVVLAAEPEGTVIVPGGPVESDTLAFVSAHAVEAIAAMRVDVVFLGACSASAAQGLTSTSYDDALIKRACIRSARRRVLVASATKLAGVSTFRFGDAGDLTHLVTTADATADMLADFRAAGVEVHLLDPPGD